MSLSAAAALHMPDMTLRKIAASYSVFLIFASPKKAGEVPLEQR